MLRKVVALCFAVMFVFSLVGCATCAKTNDLELQGLKNQVSVLEAQVQSKDQEINGLKDQVNNANEANTKVKEVSVKEPGHVLKGHSRAMQIQTALKNAGFDPGKIDGNMGKQTRDALIAFQKEHNLTPNGRATRKTWALLKGYLNVKEK